MNTTEWDAPTFKKLLLSGVSWLERHSNLVNAINIFPVPDGDTGTNMVLTTHSALNELKVEFVSTNDLLGSLAKGALMGARGNGGVIMSQIFRGMARSLADSNAQTVTAITLARMLKSGSETAYKGIVRPVEGTIVTAMRASANGAIHKSKETNDIKIVLEEVAQATHNAITISAKNIPVFLDAGFVDAGAVSLNLIYEGMLNYINGIDIKPPITFYSVPNWSYKRLKYLRALDNQFLSLISSGPITGSLASLIYSSLISQSSRDGNYVSNMDDRQWLRKTILFWSNLLFTEYGSYPYTYLRYPEKLIVESEKRLRRRSRIYREWIKSRRSTTNINSKLSLPFTTIAVTTTDGFSRLFELLGVELQVPLEGLESNTLMSAFSAIPSESILVLANGASMEFLNKAKEAHERNSRRRINVLETTDEIQGIIALTTSDPTQTFETNMQLMALGIRDCKIIRTSYNHEKKGYFCKVNDIAQDEFFKTKNEAYISAIQKHLSSEMSNIDVYADSSYENPYKTITELYSSINVNFFSNTTSAVCLS